MFFLIGGFPCDLTEEWLSRALVTAFGLDPEKYTASVGADDFASLSGEYEKTQSGSVRTLLTFTVSGPAADAGGSVVRSEEITIYKDLRTALREYASSLLCASGLVEKASDEEGSFSCVCGDLSRELERRIEASIGLPPDNGRGVSVRAELCRDEYFGELEEKFSSAAVGDTVTQEVYTDIIFESSYGERWTRTDLLLTLTLTKSEPMDAEAEKYKAVPELIGTFGTPDETHHIVQGNLYDGENYYVAFIENDNESSRVILTKLDPDGNFLKKSGPLDLDHANDIAFLPERGLLLICHCQENENYVYNVYSLVDPETLEIVYTGALERNFPAMGYSPARKLFGSIEGAGDVVDVWNGDLELIRSFPVRRPLSLSQGGYANAAGMWFVRSTTAEAGCEILIYDWELGTLLYHIPIEGMTVEPESITVVGEGVSDAEITVVCNNADYTGGEIYRLRLTER